MKRQKRDRFERAHSKGYRAHSKGYNAGISGKASDCCPFNTMDVREQWLGGWREARAAVAEGYFC